MDIDNITVTPFGGDLTRMSASFTAGDARYHVWFDPTTMELIDATLYKNPPPGIKYREPGYFDTRKLNANVSKNAAIIAMLLKAVVENKLVENAVQKVRDKEAQGQRDYHVMTLVRGFWIAGMRGEAYPELPDDITDDEFRAASVQLAARLGS